VYYDAAYRGEPVRVIAAAKPLYDPGVPGPVLIQVAQTLDSRSVLTRAILQDAVTSQTLLVVLAVAMVALGVQRALRPLDKLRAGLRARAQEDLTPVDATPAPREVQPLIAALNEHIERHARLANAQRQFLADASHQLRTPLAIVKTQAEFGLRQGALEPKDEALAAIVAQTVAATRSANQLLLLARVSPGETEMPAFERFDFAALAERTTVDFLPLARSKGIDLGFDGPSTGLHLNGSPDWLREALANVIDNALRHTPAKGQVTVRVGQTGDQVQLDVADTGPGIAPGERERVFERYYRIAGTAGEGSGLGLAIVREICTRHRGTVSLLEGAPSGLDVRIMLPL
jgi:two-component system sensor histidine kinase TctE